MNSLKYILSTLLLICCETVATSESLETRIKVAVIDTGVIKSIDKSPYMCRNGVINYTLGQTEDNHGHGSNIVGIISKGINPKTHCIVSIKFYKNEDSIIENTNSYYKALEYIDSDPQIKYLNLSLGGNAYESREKSYLFGFLKKGMTLTVASGNDGINLDTHGGYYPACYKKEYPGENFHVVRAYLGSNYGSIVTDKASGLLVDPEIPGVRALSGSSQATAQIMAEILKRGNIK